ncbi:MAG: hypothetical protein K0R47_1365 [Brevibacillus sp.]|jgi:hypothetical protein|nr:hypothetical protein [Brevibacillus sp.]
MTDVVVILFRRIRVNGVRRRIIRDVSIIGSAAPCNQFLMIGRRVGPAARCLLDNEFQRVLSRDNVLVFIRVR